MAAPPPDKPDGLGVLKSFDKMERGLTKLQNALLGTPNITLARAEAKDLKLVFSDTKAELRLVQKRMTGIIKKLQKGWIEKKKKGDK